MSLIDSIRQGGLALLQRIESFFDAFFGSAGNPWRHLGALGFYLIWIVIATGIYLFAVLDTGIEDIHTSIEYYTREQWWLGGILRSLHRYAADGLVLVMLLHILREFLYGRFHGFRWYSWITGVPTIWLVYASGIGGYWLVWDQLGLFSAVASAEWFDWLPIFSTPATRNFLPGALTDRFFSLLVFLHIGIPLILLLALWVHIQRVSQSDVFPSRALALGTLAMLLALALVKPTVSHGKADLSMVSTVLHIDWYYLFIHPLMYATSPAGLWAIAGIFTLLLLALPLLPHPKQTPIAVVNPPNCNGCRRCFVDCPYGAVAMLPHPDKPGHELAHVIPELCASCGICAGACPSSTPFRSIEQLVTGIDMPQQPVGALREEMERKIAACRAGKNRRLRLRMRRRCAPPGKRRYRRAEPDVFRPAAAQLRRVRPAQRRRRSARHRLPGGQLRLPLRRAVDGTAPDRPARAASAPGGPRRTPAPGLGRPARNERPQGNARGFPQSSANFGRRRKTPARLYSPEDRPKWLANRPSTPSPWSARCFSTASSP